MRDVSVLSSQNGSGGDLFTLSLIYATNLVYPLLQISTTPSYEDTDCYDSCGLYAIPMIAQVLLHMVLFLPPILTIWLYGIFGGGGPGNFTKWMIKYWSLYLGFFAHLFELLAYIAWYTVDPEFVIA